MRTEKSKANKTYWKKHKLEVLKSLCGYRVYEKVPSWAKLKIFLPISLLGLVAYAILCIRAGLIHNTFNTIGILILVPASIVCGALFALAVFLIFGYIWLMNKLIKNIKTSIGIYIIHLYAAFLIVKGFDASISKLFIAGAISVVFSYMLVYLNRKYA